MVYDDPEKTATSEIVIQPARRMDVYYELLVTIILVPAVMLLGIVLYMKFRKSKKHSSQETPSTPI